MISAKKEKGFTIIELLITAFIVSAGLLAVYSFFANLTATTNLSISRVEAAYLAQEGIEITRNFRDSNLIAGSAWDNGLYDGDWEADFSSSSLVSYQGRYLKIDGSGFYSYSSGSNTKFIRKITLLNSALLGIPYIKITVTVSWQEKGIQYNVSAIENIYDLQS
jgi:prepilin-type N-terminal cleavage/methylation domain-containing protein